MTKTALIIVVDASEELEVVAPVDTLRRAGVEVTVAGLNGAVDYVLSRNVILKAEVSLKDAVLTGPFDAVILPGGRIGSELLIESTEVGEILKAQEKAGRLVAAICAAPRALLRNNIFLGRSITTYPTSKDKVIADGRYVYKEDRVVIDGNLITSRGPATTIEFSLAILAYLLGKEKAEEIGKSMLADEHILKFVSNLNL